jgi:hypothetical protein
VTLIIAGSKMGVGKLAFLGSIYIQKVVSLSFLMAGEK